MFSVALVSSERHLLEDPDLPVLSNCLERLGADSRLTTWTSVVEDWSAYDLVLIRSCWDYIEQPERFMTWARHIETIQNRFEYILWNVNKRYLTDLASLNVPVVTTVWNPETERQLSFNGPFVVKPTVSASALRTTLHPTKAEAIRAAASLQSVGLEAMVQPYLIEVELVGELSLVLIDGLPSHALRKTPVFLTRVSNKWTWDEATGGYSILDVPSSAWRFAHQVMAAVMSAANSDTVPLYARVDMLPLSDGRYVLMEVELIEPALLLFLDSQAPRRMAAAILQRSQR